MTERLYEGLFLVDSNEAAKGWSDLEGHITGILEKHSARIEYSERWPDQRLATEIGGVKKGTYFLTYFTAPTQSIAEMRTDIQLSDRILRFMAVQEDYLEEEMKRRRDHGNRRPEPAPAAESSAPAEAAEAPKAEAAEEPASTDEAPTADEGANATDGATDGADSSDETASSEETAEKSAD